MFFMEGLSGVKFKVYGDVPAKKDPVNALLVANHQCVSDWIIIDSFAMRLGNAGNFEMSLKLLHLSMSKSFVKRLSISAASDN
jgi:hypothetical protein